MEHLDEQSLEALLRGDPAAVTHFREHLARACEQCEEFLMREDGLTLLEGRVDEVLMHLSPAHARAASESGFDKVARVMRGAPRRKYAAPLMLAMAAAAALVVIPLARRASSPVERPDDGVKGTPVEARIELLVAARAADGSVRRVEPGATVPASDVALFRYRASAPATAYLIARRASGQPEVLGRFELRAGEDDLRSGDGLAGLPLSDERGPLTFWLVAGPGLSVEEAARRVTKADGKGLSAASFSLTVESGQNRR